MSSSRKASVGITYNGKNVTAKIKEFVQSFTYTDVASGESDAIALKISNIDKRWLTRWMPIKGDEISASIYTYNWIKDGDKKKFRCGSFVIDDISFSGRPLEGDLGAVAIPARDCFKSTERTKTWKSITVRSIANEIAKRSNIDLHYSADSISIHSIEQSNQTDCSFLYSLCQSYGLAMKVYHNKIIIFDEVDYEKKRSVATFYESELLSWEYNTTLTKTYTGAKISYTNASTKKDVTVKVGSGEGARVLNINERADNHKDAELKAYAAMRNANKKMTTMQITIKANPKVIASSNINIRGLGKINGKYAVDKITHTVGSGYTMALELRLISHSTNKTINPFRPKK